MINSYVDDILDLGRIEGGGFKLNPKEFKLEELINETKELFENEAKGKMISLNFSISNLISSRLINTDKDRLRQVLINLVSNALKFTSSSITVEIFDMLEYVQNKNSSISLKVNRMEKDVVINNQEANLAIDLALKLIEKNKLDPSEYIYF
mmetsp:Transcript_10672/g.9385  ORF Transcript_10672/g.9385 Transcript_10672/m.9385 type:complete len:151 (-) Transcript_10672:253-705(-)